MAGGEMDSKTIHKAMRSLATKLLSNSIEPKKKMYLVHYVDPVPPENPDADAEFMAYDMYWEEDEVPADYVAELVSQGDHDARAVQTFERDLEDMFHEKHSVTRNGSEH